MWQVSCFTQVLAIIMRFNELARVLNSTYSAVALAEICRFEAYFFKSSQCYESGM